MRRQLLSIICLLCASPAYAQSVDSSVWRDALALIFFMGLVVLAAVLIRQALRPGALNTLAVAIVARLIKAKRRIGRSWTEIARQARDRADQ
ncbi:exported hypothetical protein [Mesorhizobium ventifaucium]|uniref:Uncharacterized protein n=1 Tax=Mesorhizobium ventifaucium TaxID=666020 RepID=A0ABN8JBP3_9HYPH|nr:exported hypothetical protein [Mesorhizobium ventifaucium]